MKVLSLASPPVVPLHRQLVAHSTGPTLLLYRESQQCPNQAMTVEIAYHLQPGVRGTRFHAPATAESSQTSSASQRVNRWCEGPVRREHWSRRRQPRRTSRRARILAEYL